MVFGPSKAELKRIGGASTGPQVLVCPSGFKESPQPGVVANCIEAGVVRAMPDAIVTKATMVDGGEGCTQALVATTIGEMHHLDVMGPIREPFKSQFGVIGTLPASIGVIEMAAAAGLSLVPADQRNPMHTTSFGVGQLIKAALDQGVEDILLGCGDSATCDGGVGMAQALGTRFFTSTGDEITQAMGDICFTAEGVTDEQTPRGKIPAYVARLAKEKGAPVIALAGTVDVGARINYEAGIDAYASILQEPSTLQMAIEEAERLLTDAAESAMRMVMVGRALNRVMAPVRAGQKGADIPMVMRRT